MKDITFFYGFARFRSLFFTDMIGKSMLKKLEIVMRGIFVYLYSLQSWLWIMERQGESHLN